MLEAIPNLEKDKTDKSLTPRDVISTDNKVDQLTPAQGMELDLRYEQLLTELRESWLQQNPGKDFFSFVAVKKSKVWHVLQLIKSERTKNKKVKIEIVK